MRSALLVAVVLMAGTARGEFLVTEVKSTFWQNGLLYSSPTSIGWEIREYPAAAGVQINPSLVGIAQRREIIGDTAFYLNSSYRNIDFNNDNSSPFEYEHAFSLEVSGDGVGPRRISLSTRELFVVGGSHEDSGPFSLKRLDVTPHYAPPNGNSFVGSDMRFTAIEFTLNAWTDEDNDELIGTASQTRIFTVRFYGVPEPTSALPIMLCAIVAYAARFRKAHPPLRGA